MYRHLAGRFFLACFSTLGALWTVIEILDHFFPSSKLGGLTHLLAVLSLCIFMGGLRAFPRKRIEFPIPITDSSFEIRFGDIFEREGVIVIPVNEYFDGELGDHVSTRSLHGKFIKKKLGGRSEEFISRTHDALVEIDSKGTHMTRSSGQTVRYEIGTVARMFVNDQVYLLSALTHTNRTTLEAFATLGDLWTCLSGVWKGIRRYSGGMPVSIPLIGSGLSGVGLPREILVEIIIQSFIYYTKKEKVADKVTLVLPQSLRWTFDLKGIKRSVTYGIPKW